MATVLKIVQNVLSVMDSDDVSSISETEEAEQLATLVEMCYYDIIDKYDLGRTKSVFQLTGLGDVSYPTHLTFDGTTIVSMEYFAYDVRAQVADAKKYVPLQYLTPVEFQQLCAGRDSTASNIEELTHIQSTATFLAYNDKAPEFYTIYDDTWVVLDSYNNVVDTTVQGSKTNCYGELRNVITLDNVTHIPLPNNMIQLLEKEVLELAFEVWKEGAPPRIKEDVMRARVRTQRRKQKLRINQERDQFTGPHYGRRP